MEKLRALLPDIDHENSPFYVISLDTHLPCRKIVTDKHIGVEMDIVIDTSGLIAVIVDEPERDKIEV